MRNGEKIWFCERIYSENEETPIYKAPEEFILCFPSTFNPIGITVQPSSGFTNYFEYGETTSSDQKIILQPYLFWNGKFKRGDLFYLDGEVPSESEICYGENANYYVDFVAKQNESIVLSLKQIKNNERR